MLTYADCYCITALLHLLSESIFLLLANLAEVFLDPHLVEHRLVCGLFFFVGHAAQCGLALYADSMLTITALMHLVEHRLDCGLSFFEDMQLSADLSYMLTIS